MIIHDMPDAEYVRIALREGRYALIDAADAGLVSGIPWRVLEGHTGRLYAYARVRGRGLYMHRLIANTPAGMETDHINGDGLDNRRANLRIATPSQNSANTWKPAVRDGRVGHSSRFKGVSWDSSRSKWAAYITVDRKARNLGRYADEESAARAYDAAALAAWGEFARTNFEDANT